jgi:hypothetical protein
VLQGEGGRVAALNHSWGLRAGGRGGVQEEQCEVEHEGGAKASKFTVTDQLARQRASFRRGLQLGGKHASRRGAWPS